MSSSTGLTVLKNSFTWKFSKYPRFHKKIKLQIQEKDEVKKGVEVEGCGFWGKDHDYQTVSVTSSEHSDSDPGDRSGGCISPCWQFESDKPPSASDEADYSTIQYSSISFGSDGPVYENTVGYLQPSPSLLLSYSPEDDVEDHIYDYVDNSLLESRPANIFLSLLEGEGTTISPDPNIYEVPPGAIFNSESCFEELFPLSDISPPNGFQDKLTWERFHLISGNGEDNNEAIYSLPIKFSLNGSAIVKPRKKKLRPGIEELLNQITTMKDTTMEEEQKDNKSEEQELPPQNDLTKDVSLKSESKSPTEPIDSVSESFPVTVSTCPSSNEVIVENINHAIPINLTVLQATVDSLPVEATEVPEPRVTETQDPLNSKEFTSIIEISGDGTWNTAKIPSSHVETSKAIESIIPDESAEQDFLTVNADARAKHVTLAYSGQYYTGNCPVASIKPMKHEQDASVDTKKNIGAQIMEKYEEERKKIIEIKNLPDISLLDVDESLEEIQKERRKIIESQAVRAKRIDSWIKGGPVPLDADGVPVKCELQDCDDAIPLPDSDSINIYLDENGEVVYDSIIQNKSKIKSYWEQLMIAAELSKSSAHQHVYSHHLPHAPTPAAAPAPAPAHTSPPATTPHVVPEKIPSPDLSETEYYDALSHISQIQTPELTEKSAGAEGLVETVVQRDIRLQRERELALAEERQKALRSTKTPIMTKTAQPTSLPTPTPAPAKEEELHRQHDEAYLSIPTTDEGNFSEYGSEDKEDNSPDESRVTSPVGPAGITSHHRTQSLDSMSSGHSSGSGFASHPDLTMTKTERRQTFGPVKPLDEPEDIDLLTFVKTNTPSVLKDQSLIPEPLEVEVRNSECESGHEKETPIEREIRLAREREEELRREKRISAIPLAVSPSTSIPPAVIPTPPPAEPEKKVEPVRRAANTRVSPATQRVQQEIEQATEREKELKRWTSEKEVAPVERKLKPTTLNIEFNNKDSPPPPLQSPRTPVMKSAGASPKIYIQNPQQKGLMKRFLASRGKMGSTPRLSPTSATMPPLRSPAISPSSLLTEPFISFTSVVQSKEKGEEPINLGTRPGYKSAEDKIQNELREMRRREEELRQQRRTSLYSARSQPDLLNIDNEPLEPEPSSLEDEPTRLPNMSKLRSALSVQNLLDVGMEDKPAPRRLPKKKSALIEQWESRIKNTN